MGLNAKVFEKRGGHMGLFGHMVLDGNTEVVTYIANRYAIVTGHQQGNYCNEIGLESLVSNGEWKRNAFYLDSIL